MKTRFALTFLVLALVLALIVVPGSAQGRQTAAEPVPASANLSPAGVEASPATTAAWLVESVDGGQSVGTYVSVAIDAEGTPYLSYYDDANKALKMAKHVGEGGNCGGPDFHWACETVDDSSGDVGKYSSIAIDPTTDLPSIAYWNATSPKHLKLATASMYGWVITTVKTALGRYASLKIDATGTEHIAYHRYGVLDTLEYARQVGGGAGNCGGGDYQCNAVDAGFGGVGIYPSLALDGSGQPRISYFDGGNNLLMYASKNGGAWTTNKIVTTDQGQHTSLDVDTDAGNRPHIAYGSATSGKLGYAVHVGGGGNCGFQGSWQCDEIDTVGTKAHQRDVSLALDKAGLPIIAYHRYIVDGTLDVKSLDVARPAAALGLQTGNCGPQNLWQCELIRDTIHPGDYSSIAVSPSGLATIAYYSSTAHMLRVARQRYQITVPLALRNQ